MTGSANRLSVFTSLVVTLLVVDRSWGDPRSQVIGLTCHRQPENNETTSIPNFVQSVDKVVTQIPTSHGGTADTDGTYVLAECFGDLSTDDCYACTTKARANLPTCFPTKGAQIFLDGCFLRTQNYNFYQEYIGSNDTAICGNITSSRVFEDSVREVVSDVVRVAPKNKHYFARNVKLSDTANASIYVLADCWDTLNESSCTKCLNSALESMVKCFPWSEGRALHTGCFIRYSNTEFINPKPTRGKNVGKTLALVISVCAIGLLLVASIIMCYAWKRRRKLKMKHGSDDKNLLELVKSSSLNFKYSTIEKATRHFSEASKLGQGGFGSVYKGVLQDGREVAVKRLFFNHRHRAADFYNEVNIISSVDHPNLVKLVGFSCLGPDSILVYEYLPNKSLDQFIFDADKGKELNWEKRFGIIVGTAEGLVYLHENSKTRIIHRDIKAANILLDSGLHAKIADFGLARSYEEDKNHISTGIAGTLGYMAPEYIIHGQLTEKVDVYSFGVLILEVVTGKPNRSIYTSDNSRNLLSVVWEHFKDGSVEEIFDPNLTLQNETDNNIKKVIHSVVHIGFLCTQEIPSLRPTMSMALQMLSNNIKPLPYPTNPPFIYQNDIQFNDFSAVAYASASTVSHSSFSPTYLDASSKS